VSLQDRETSTAVQSTVAGTRAKGLLRVLMLMLALYGFLLSVNLMGKAFGLILGKEQARQFLQRAADDPFMALMAGILCTAIVQSSSFVTSVVVGLVASGALGPGALGIERAVPIIMGANIGTSVTNMLVSLGHISRKDEFRRACGGAIVHDLFNLMTVAVLFPLERATRFLSWSAQRLGDLLFGHQTVDLPNPLAWIVKPVSKALATFATDTVGLSNTAAGGILAGVAMVALFVALYALVKLLRALMLERVEGLFQQVLFRNAPTALVVGLLTTVLVQSSSVTTSIMVPCDRMRPTQGRFGGAPEHAARVLREADERPSHGRIAECALEAIPRG